MAFTWSLVSFIAALMVLVVGYFFSVNAAKKLDDANREDLLTRVQTAAFLTKAEDVATLTGTEADFTSPAYARIKTMLYGLHDINNGVRFIYFMRPNADQTKLIFLADSESPESKDYSPPGEVYEQTTDLELNNYENAVAFVEGPYTDPWGSWVSAYAPVWYQGKLVGQIGMDVSAAKWEAKDHSFQLGIIIRSVLVAIGFILIGMYIRRSLMCLPEGMTIEQCTPKDF